VGCVLQTRLSVRQKNSLGVYPKPKPFAPAPKPEPIKTDGPKLPSKLERLGVFLASRGFRWDEGSERFMHPDRSLVQRIDGVFSWELVTTDWVNLLWLAPASLSDPTGIEIPGEGMACCKRLRSSPSRA
jgi:hypothetical protein